MNKIKELYQKHKEIILYLIFGVLTTLVNFVAFWLFDLILTSKYYLVSNFIAWVVAVVFAFFVNKLFVFTSKTWEIRVVWKESLEFLGARVFSFVIEELGLLLFVDGLDFKSISFKVFFFTVTGQLIAKVILAVIVIILNYFFSKFIIFKKNDPKEKEE